MKQSLLVEADGGPLAVTIAGANVPDAQLLAQTIDAIVLERPEPEPDFPSTSASTRATTTIPAGKRPSTPDMTPTSR